MNNISTFSIPKDVVSQAGNSMGIKANQLASFFGLGESTESKSLEEGWENILPTLLQPRNFSGIIALFQDDSLLFTNILTGEKDTIFCGEEDGNLKVIPMSQTEISEFLAAYLGEVGEPSKIKQELSADALIVMLSIADSIRRAKLDNMLNPSKKSFEITEESLKMDFEKAVKSSDLRWLAPFLAELRWESKTVDFSKALNELSKLSIIRFKNNIADIAEMGEVFFEELLKRRTIIGIRSVFYQNGVLNYLAMAFMRTENYLWFLGVTDKACIMSLKYDELKGMIAAMISPGEAPPEKTELAEITDKANEKIITPKFCKNCGAKLSNDAKFCKSCGKKIG
ncbi:MAG: zinc-ribbon domain-containing protein [Sedimentibacter sp.]